MVFNSWIQGIHHVAQKLMMTAVSPVFPNELNSTSFPCNDLILVSGKEFWADDIS
jgi:hypothetical protein